MTTKSVLSYLMVACLLFGTTVVNAVAEFQPIPKSYESVYELPADDLINLEKDDLEEKIGRKLNFKEKHTLKFVKKKLKKNPNLTGEAAKEQVTTDGLAIAGFICGLASLFVLGIILGILGIVFSSIALKRINAEPETRKGKGFAIAGLILGIIGVVGALLFLSAL